ncbi:MAG: hypothetical protein ABI229_03380 [Gemmatimonadaceae bacterium]
MHIHKVIDRQEQFVARVVIAALASALLAVPSFAAAQGTPQLDARWQPWIGCWQPVVAPATASSLSQPRNSDAPLVCVIPATGATGSAGVDVVTIANGKITARDNITANGQNVARSKDGCNGVESANWSADNRRVYVSSDFTCPGGLKRTSSGLFAISPTGQWVNVQSVNSGGSSGVRVLHYTDAGMPSTLPSEISQTLGDRSLAVSTARAAVGARLTGADVVEASRKVDSTVVEAWIVDRGQAFAVDAKQLIALADAGVPSNVTDAMVAVSYPRAFVVNRESDVVGPVAGAVEAAQDASGADIERSSPRQVQVIMMPAYSPYGYSPYGFSPFDYYGYGYSPYGYGPYGYSPYGYSSYRGYYSPYTGYGAYGGLYAPPIIVLKGNQPTQQQGYAVRGRGYTQSAPRNGGSSGSTGSTAEPRPTASPPPASSTRTSPPPSQPASSGRTAHERP